MSSLFLGLKSSSCVLLKPYSQNQRHAFLLLLNGLLSLFYSKAHSFFVFFSSTPVDSKGPLANCLKQCPLVVKCGLKKYNGQLYLTYALFQSSSHVLVYRTGTHPSTNIHFINLYVIGQVFIGVILEQEVVSIILIFLFVFWIFFMVQLKSPLLMLKGTDQSNDLAAPHE